MRLVQAEIKNFRSIEDTGAFRIDNLTCLVGKNEAGKTAVLQALQGLFPYGQPQTVYDRTKENPRRHATKFDERHPHGNAEVVITWWELTDDELKILRSEFGEDAVTGKEVVVRKYYGSGVTSWTMPINQAVVVSTMIAPDKLTSDESAPLKESKTTQDLKAKLSGIEGRTSNQEALLSRLNTFRDGSAIKKGIDLIDHSVPKFFYASHYDRMSGEISTNKLSTDRSNNTVTIGDRIFLDFLELAGTSLEELEGTQHYEELKAKCEAASNDITEQIFRYWTQNDALEVNLDFSQGKPSDPPPFNSGTVVRARVWNTLHRASVPFSERSAGFVWFFSFLVQFAAMRKEAGNVIILLDEPGLTLHGKAQADLLEYIKNELLPHHQVIFSTHSPFMVPADRFSSVRVVEDVVKRAPTGRPEIIGTKVREDVLVTNKDTLFPLQGALGYDIAQSLFVGKNTLLVEGPSDILYLQALSEALRLRKREALDPRWTICPAGGIDKVRPFVSLFGGNHLNVAVLTDIASGDKKKIEDLRKSEILQSGRIFTAGDFTGKSEADVEDFFDASLYCKIVNSAYALSGKNAISPDILAKAAPDTTRIVKQTEAQFKILPTTVPEFDHFAPAAWLIKNLSILDEDSSQIDETLARAETCFKSLNALL